MELLSPDQVEKKQSTERRLSATCTSTGETEGDWKLRKTSSDSESAAVKTKPQLGSSDLIRIFGGTAVPGNNYEISDSDMESEEEGDEAEQGEEKKKETKLNIFKGGLAKKIVTLTEEKKGGRIGQLFRKSPEGDKLTSSSESLQMREEEGEASKLKKFKTGLGRRLNDIVGDMQDIRDEGLHSLNELKVEYQERAEQKKAMITSFTEEEVKIFRKGSPLPNQVTKQMSSLYLAKRHSILRLSLISASNLSLPPTPDGSPLPTLSVKMSIGPERFKTRQVGWAAQPVWQETTCMARQSGEDDTLKLEVLARGSKETVAIGVGQLCLASYSQDSCSRICLPLEPGIDGEVQEGSLDLVIWVTGGGVEQSPLVEKAEPLEIDTSQFGLRRTFENVNSVGILTVTVVEASGLGSSKLQGALNPFCMLELDNQFHRTRTAMKTKCPIWDKTFHFDINDAFSILKISVASEKMNSPLMVVGRASLRLSSLHGRTGEQLHLWLPLKDRKLRKSAKGDNPRVHLQITYAHNRVRAAVAAFMNREDSLVEVERPKFDRVTLLRNVGRIKIFLPKGSTIQRVKQSYTDIIAWKEPARTVKYFIFYMFFVYYFQIWWIPAAILWQLFRNYRSSGNRPNIPKLPARDESMEEEDEDEDNMDGKEERKSLKQSLDTLQNTLLEFQEGCGLVASYLERISNMAHFEEAFLTGLFCFVLILTSLVLGTLGLRTVLLLWGVNKFTKKLREADPIPTNEIDNLLSRVPDHEMVEDCRDPTTSPASPPSSPTL